MFKLVFFLIGLGLAILFAAVNIGNTTDLSLLFVKFKDVPVFLTASISFLFGAIFTLPFAFWVSPGGNKKKRKTKKERKKNIVEESLNDETFIDNEEI